MCFCPERCDKCNICKEMTDVFTELQDSCFFYPKTVVANNHNNIPYQPVLWRIFTSIIDKNKKILYRDSKINSKSWFGFKLLEDTLIIYLFRSYFVI